MPKDSGKTYKAEAALTLHETPKSKLGEDTMKRGGVEEVMTASSIDKTESILTDALSKLKKDGGVSYFLY